MRERKKGYGIMMALTIILTLAAVISALPYSGAVKESYLGYKAVCSFTPFSALILLTLAGVACKVRKNKYIDVTYIELSPPRVPKKKTDLVGKEKIY